MRSININNYNIPSNKEWERSVEQTEFHGDNGEYYKIVDKKTPAGFSVERQTADVVSDLLYTATNSLSTATSMLITTYRLDNEKSAEILKRVEAIREQAWQLKADVDRDLRGLGD